MDADDAPSGRPPRPGAGTRPEQGPSSGREPLARTPGRARELSRTSSARRRTVDTGRRHHIGDAPDVMSVLRPDGSRGTTRTSPIQLADRNDARLRELLDELAGEMAAAAAALDFERAAHLRDEVAAARAEVARRSGGA